MTPKDLDVVSPPGVVVARIGKVLLWSAIALSILVVSARAFGWGAGPLFFLVALTPYVGVAAVLLAIVSGVARLWAATAVCLGVALVVAVWWVPTFSGDSVHGRPLGLTVMTANVEVGHADPAAIVNLVKAYRVDLLSLQELTQAEVAALQREGLDELLPHRFLQPDPGQVGSGIWSRYPLRHRRASDDHRLDNVAATVVAPFGRVAFLGVHPPPPGPLSGTSSDDAFATTYDFVTSSRDAAIAAGDFNATRDNAPLRQLESAGFVDSAPAVGAGLVRTWYGGLPLFPPLVGIDHVLSRDVAGPRSVAAVGLPGSDHRALVVEF